LADQESFPRHHPQRGRITRGGGLRLLSEGGQTCAGSGVRKLLSDLAETEQTHEEIAANLESTILTPGARAKEAKTSGQIFLLQYVQPGLVGLMDGSVSTLAPVFAAAFATHNNWQTFLVGLAASLGAGISMGFAEALSDDGSITGAARQCCAVPFAA